MKIIKARNVCQALPQTVNYLLEKGRREPSRAGNVIVASNPMIIETQCPNERVLFSPIRDANPFFHIMEAIWMLGGRQDAKFLDTYVKNFSTMYAEEGGTLHDAYGYRWRRHFGLDQLQAVIDKLRANPYDRQCVIQMWDADVADDLLGEWKGRPCNTNLFLRVNNNNLDMTVCCRSNDMLWGAHGSNAVHFSVLQEYLAASLGVSIGVLYQISNNAHIYEEALTKLQFNSPRDLLDDRYDNIIGRGMFNEPKYVYEDIDNFFEGKTVFRNDWFSGTLLPIKEAHQHYRNKKINSAIAAANRIDALDWRIACTEWIERRCGE